MQRRPVALLVAALIFLYFPLSLVWGASRGQHVSVTDWVLYGAFPTLLTFGLIRVTRIAWYTLVGFILLWGIHDLSSFYGEQSSGGQLLTRILIYLFSLTYFINPRIRHLYFDPKTRWWRTKQRFETHAPVMVRHQDDYSYPVLRNISEGGCFIETPHPAAMAERVYLTLPLPYPLGVSAVQTEGEVRWVSRGASRPGMGIQFSGLSPENLEAVKQFVARQL